MSSKNNSKEGKAPEATGTAPDEAKVPTTNPVPENYPVFIPLLPGKHQPDFQGSVNGVPFQLPRGQVANLPRHIYEVVMNTLSAEQRASQDYYKAQAQLLARAKEEEDRILGK